MGDSSSKNTETSRISSNGSRLQKEVVLVHGILNTGGVFRRMKNYLVSEGLNCHVIKLKPNWGGASIEELSKQLLEFIESRIQSGSDLSLIGFSMGALVSRYYLQELGGHMRVKRFFSVSGPHHGTLIASLWVGKGTAQMRLGSPFLKSLNENQSVLKKMKIVSYRTPFENVIIPSSSSHWDLAENIIFPIISHQWMPFSKLICQDITSRILKD